MEYLIAGVLLLAGIAAWSIARKTKAAARRAVARRRLTELTGR